MSLPAAELQFPDHLKVLATTPSQEAQIPPGIPQTEKTRILIADDDRMSREVLAFRLDQAGYEVIVTRDGQGAIDELRKSDAPAVAILDWLMPGMDGPTICQRMRDAHKSVYLILLTARTRSEDVVEGLDSGADEYLSKPVETEELLARIKVGLRIIGEQRALAEKVAELEAPQPTTAQKMGFPIA